jgi:hypothetical protein
METNLTIKGKVKKIEKPDPDRYNKTIVEETTTSCEVHLEGSSEIILLLIPKIESLVKEQGWTL